MNLELCCLRLEQHSIGGGGGGGGGLVLSCDYSIESVVSSGVGRKGGFYFFSYFKRCSEHYFMLHPCAYR